MIKLKKLYFKVIVAAVLGCLILLPIQIQEIAPPAPIIAIQEEPILIKTKPVIIKNKQIQVSRSGESIHRYQESELHMLAKIVYAEGNLQPRRAKVAMLNVILNRITYFKKYKSSFAGTIEGVIFAHDKRGTYQFTPIKNGSYRKAPITDENIEIAKSVLSGEKGISDEAIFFVAKSASNYMQGRKFIETIGNINFYGK